MLNNKILKDKDEIKAKLFHAGKKINFSNTYLFKQTHIAKSGI